MIEKQANRVEFMRNLAATHLKLTVSNEGDYESLLEKHDWKADRFFIDYEHWYEAEIDINNCFIAHEEFRGFKECGWAKKVRFCDILPCIKKCVENGIFPFSDEIKKSILEYPRVYIRACGSRLDVLDGQKRVVTLAYHGVATVNAYIYRGSLLH